MHWLTKVASKAGWLDTPLAMPGTLTMEQAWHTVARASGRADGELADLLTREFRMARADAARAEKKAASLVPAPLARRYGVYALRENNREITVATANPMDTDAEQMIAFSAGRRVVFEIATPAEISDWIDDQYGADERRDRAASVEVVGDHAPEVVRLDEVHEAPIINITNDIIREAIEHRASDIHMGPGPGGAVVKLRIDGVLEDHSELPLSVLSRVISRIKVIADMDIADRVRPQDGRARVRIDDQSYDLRVSVVPAREAEKAVIRVLRPQGSKRLEETGLSSRDLELLRQLLQHRNGMIIVTGPTGSGKTTTLYGLLRELAREKVNITTIEDPVEYEMPEITQVQTDARRDLTFASALRSVLRQDPDIILVGEIRDRETAEIAVKAAMTGHLVLSTLHTNDAIGAVARLQEIGIEPRALASTLRGVIAQRLVRRVCTSCVGTGRKPVTQAACRECRGSGFFGRTPVVEILTCSDGVVEQITAGGSARSIQQEAAAHGFRTMAQAAQELAAAGVTTRAEVERVLGSAPAEPETETRKRALIVDDDPVLRMVASALLTADGFEVSEAENGQEALDRLNSSRVHVVVSDLRMPAVDGLELVRRLRADPRTAALPVVVMTAAQEEQTEVTLIDAGATDYVRKPLEPARFAARVRAAVRRTGGFA